MHILYLQQLLVPPGGPGNSRCWEFAAQWAAQGHRITFVSSAAHIPPQHPVRRGLSLPCYARMDGVEMYLLDVPYSHMMPLPRRAAAFVQFMLKARRLIRFLDADAVLAYTAPPSVAALGRWAAGLLKRPFFLEVADVWPDVPQGMGLLPGWAAAPLQQHMRTCYAAAERIFAYSEGMKAQMVSQGADPERVLVSPNGVRLGRFGPQPLPLHRGLRALYAGTMGRANGVQFLLDAAARLHARGRDDIRLTLIGDGTEGARIRDAAARLNLPNLEILPPVPSGDVPGLMRQFEAGIVCFAPYPVLEANSATKWFEYLAAGLPVLINYGGWQAEWLDRHACGLAAPQGDLEAFVRNLIALADDPARRRDMGLRARRLAEASFGRHVLASRMLEEMQAAVQAGSSQAARAR
ncbi:MAG: glycosyltransferase family 4 protein [Bacteroidia bacterium]|nr:glycosyltransferase family 4 protein [Bacteroidia bacterium]